MFKFTNIRLVVVPSYKFLQTRPHAKDTYAEAFHASQSRVLYSLFREDIKGQMKLPPKGGEEAEEEE